MRIYKYSLALLEHQTLMLPVGAQILTVQVQHGQEPCLWALVNPDAPTQPRSIWMYGTGHPIYGSMADKRYIGTIQLNQIGSLVFHFFESVN